MGRHKEFPFDPEIAARICDTYAKGVSLASIVDESWYPAKTLALVYDWLKLSPEFAMAFQVARQACAEIMASDTLDIADQERDPQRARVKIQARQWFASKLDPKHWGDKVQVEHEHKLDLTQALEQAKQRMLLPVRDQHETIEGSAVDITGQIRVGSTDYKSDDQDDDPDFLK